MSVAGHNRLAPDTHVRQVVDPWWIRPILGGWLALLGPYLVMRVAWVAWSSPLGVPALLFDVCSVLVTLGTVLTLRRLYIPVHPPVNASKYTVDCLVPTHHEDPAVVEPTVLAALAIRGLRTVLVLGNADRPEMRRMCDRLGVAYLPRGNNRHAKAGNLNHGLRYTDAQYVLVLDADHLARPDILERVMGYLDDKRVGYVQGPQTYYNTETFLFRHQYGHPAGWSDQQAFYHGLQIGRNGWGGALFMGSTAVLRREALDDIGGFAEGTITEDVHTSLRLQAHGWRAVAVVEPLAFGLEAGNFREYHNQRHRWAAGALTLLRSPDSPLRARGLPLRARAGLLAVLTAALGGVARLGLIAVPVLTLLSLCSPVTESYVVFGPVQAAWLVLTASLLHVLHRGASHPRYASQYAYGSLFAQLTAVVGLLVRSRTFVSSHKVVDRADGHWAKWALRAVAGLAVCALTRAAYLLIGPGGSAMVVWCAILAAFQLMWLLAFLVELSRFERNPTQPAWAGLSGADRYRYVLDRFRAGAIGPVPPVLGNASPPSVAE